MVSKWINDNYEDLKKTVRNITRNDELSDDLLHECIYAFMNNQNADKVIENGSAKYFFIRIVLNQYRSTTSSFYRNWKKPTLDSLRLIDEWWEDIPDETDYDFSVDELVNLNFNLIEELLKSDNNMERYYGFIVIMWFSNDMNFAEVARLLNVSRSTIRRQFDEATKIIISRMNKLDTKITYNQLPLKIYTTELLKGYGKGRRY